MQAILSPYLWDTADLGGYWRAPDGAAGGIDLRNLTACGSPGPVAQGHGYFVLPDGVAVPDGAMLLGEMGGLLRQSRADVDTYLGLPSGTVQSLDTSDLLAELILQHADPTGETRWKPLRANFRSGVRIHIAGLTRSEKFTTAHPAWANTLAVYQADYRSSRAWIDTLPARDAAAAFSALRRYTGWMRLAYRLGDEYGVLLPDEYKAEGYEDPATTIGDTFVEDGGNVNLQDHTATGPNSGFSWTRTGGSASGNVLVVAADDEIGQADSDTNMRYRAESDLSSDDMDSEFDITTVPTDSGDNIGPAARYASAADSCYVLLQRNTATATYRLFKLTTGTFSQIGSSVNATAPVAPYNSRLSVDASSLEAFISDVSVIGPETDMSFTGQTRAGLLFAQFARGDNWLAADKDAGGDPNTRRYSLSLTGVG